MMDDMDAPWPVSDDRALVTRELPRLVRVALTKRTVFDAVVETIVIEIDAIDSRIAGSLRAAIDDRRFPELRALRDPVVAKSPPTIESAVRLLDRKSARNMPAAAGVGDVLLMLFGNPTDRATCARLAASCRDAVQSITPRSLTQALASKAGMGAIDWRAVATVVEHHAVQSSSDEREVDEIDAAQAEVAPSPDPLVDRALQIDGWLSAAAEAMSDVRNLIVGLSCMAAGQASSRYAGSLGEHALHMGENVLHRVRVAAEERVVAKYEQLLQGERRRRVASEMAAKTPDAVILAEVATPPGYVLVAPKIEGVLKVKEIIRGHEHLLGKPIPLIATPDLASVERELLREFPHCESIVRATLREMAGQAHVTLRPLLLRGDPGSGKSRFARRLGELLGVGVFRVDGAGDAGVSFAGTERRWYSTEPCRPFMACSRFSHANPLVLIDEIDKAPTRNEHGRLWDGLLGFLERETSERFQDPCLQSEVNLSHVLYVATANDATKLPGPLLDRFGVIVDFPNPDRSHLAPLARHLAEDLASAQGMDPRFVRPFEAEELAVMSRHWRGGSVRRLGRIVATVVRARELSERRMPN